MAFDQYGMPSSGQQGGQVLQTGPRAPKPAGYNPPFNAATDPNGDPFSGGGDTSAGSQTVSNPYGVGAGKGVVGPQTPAPPTTPPSTTPFDRQGFMNAWMGSSGSVDQFKAANPQYASAFGNGSGDVYTLPTGEKMDLMIDYGPGGANKHAWTGLNGGDGSGNANGSSTGSGPAGTGNGSGAFSGNAGFSPYTPGQLPQTNFSTYTPGNVQQYSQFAPQANQVLQQVLNAPALSPEVVNQMEGQLKDQALTMNAGAGQDIKQQFANRGYGPQSGEMTSQLNNLNQGMESGLLNNYRDLNVGAAQSNRTDMLNALNAASSQYGTNLSGQMGQEQLNQAGVQSQNASTQFALQRALEEEGMKQAAAGMGITTRGQDIQNSQFGQNLGLNYAQLAQQGNIAQGQLGLGYGQLGLGYAGLNANNNNTQQSALLKALGL